MDPKGKVALITGAARIGASVADELARRGCHIAVSYRSSKSAAERTVKSASGHGVRAMAVAADLAVETGVVEAVSRVQKELGGIDILVHMASLYRKVPVKAITDRIWQEQLETDLASAYRMAGCAAPVMKRRGAGRMIFLSDWVAASGRPRYRDFLPYYVAKRGIIGLAEALALEWAPEILVNAIAPGPILKPPGLSAREDAEVKKATPLGRWGGPAEIAKAVMFLIETDFVTGECVRVDGGRHLS
jgi:NAD(P)-dependent dehydrogenase (short-subunit alcohol dehydrogenase family)